MSVYEKEHKFICDFFEEESVIENTKKNEEKVVRLFVKHLYSFMVKGDIWFCDNCSKADYSDGKVCPDCNSSDGYFDEPELIFGEYVDDLFSIYYDVNPYLWDRGYVSTTIRFNPDAIYSEPNIKLHLDDFSIDVEYADGTINRYWVMRDANNAMMRYVEDDTCIIDIEIYSMVDEIYNIINEHLAETFRDLADYIAEANAIFADNNAENHKEMPSWNWWKDEWCPAYNKQ